MLEAGAIGFVLLAVAIAAVAIRAHRTSERMRHVRMLGGELDEEMAELADRLGAVEADIRHLQTGWQFVAWQHRLARSAAVERALAALERRHREATLPMGFPSHYGEDRLAWAASAANLHGTFVEAGAGDGRTRSATYALEALGWRGLLVEAHPERAAACRVLRVGSEVVHVALTGASPLPGSLFHVVSGSEPWHAALSFLEPAEANMAEVVRVGARSNAVKVPTATLAEVLADRFETIDVLFLDLSGGEAAALETLGQAAVRPRLVVVADRTETGDGTLAGHLLALGYGDRGRLGCLRVFVAAGETLVGERVDAFLVHVGT